MFLARLKQIFSKDGTATGHDVGLTGQPIALNDFLKEEVWKSPFIRSEHRASVLKSISNGNLLAEGPTLTTEEKKTIGAKVQTKLYKAQAEAITQDGLVVGAKKVLTSIRLRAFHRHARLSSLIRMKEAGLSQYRLLASNDERDCLWCRTNDSQVFEICVDINALIEKNCTCEYCRCTVIPSRNKT